MIYLGYFLLDLYIFFIMYVASMAMIRAHAEKKLNGVLWGLCAPFVLLSMLVDFIHNMIIFTVLFLELPRELLVTDRLKRHVKQNTWRSKFAHAIGDTLLNSFDHTGNHLD